MSGSDFSERRSSLRLDMEQQLVTIRWQNTDSETIERDVVCKDVSNGGLKLELGIPIDVNSQVTIFFTPANISTQTFNAKVIRCAQCEHGWYELGLQFTK